MEMCNCPACRPRRNNYSGLGFSIDWGGIATNVVKAYGTVAANKSAIKLAQAQQAAALRAQELEFQRMQRAQALTPAQPADGGVVRVVAAPRPAGGMMAGLPQWAIPAGVGVLALAFLMRK
ncbi:MAG: hypothetical protein EKK55_21790 [Rhodocyclaceae bacterium]|nr:MAG: hypothetical protein EKK55_21790 [Rhodocyclaceae bacterium]